jgi:hypothetical protein
MKKIILLLGFAIILFAISCKKNEVVNNNDLSIPSAEHANTALNAGPNQYLGVTCGFQYSGQLAGPVTYPNQQNQSMYNPDPANPNLTWDSWVEQMAQAGIDFVCPNLTGSQPNTNGSATKIAPMITAINARGLTNQLKLAAFDDNAASWCAQWNQANGRGYGYAQKFDMADPNNWKYIYDYNYKVFYQTVPDANRFKINGRPVIIIWTGNTNTFVTNMNGNASQALTYVRNKCQADFGFNPYIILSGDFFTNDPTCNNPGIADGKENWFTPPNTAWSLASFNSTTIGVAVAQFQHPGQGAYLNPNHGVLFDNALSSTVEAGALLTLCEGFTDYEEDAAMWRAANIAPNGSAYPYASSGYDYPNQRINILRKHSRNPFPTELKLEAEGADNFGGASGGNGKTNYYRNGNIAIAETNDAMGGHHVGWMATNEWLEWQELPFSGNVSLQVRIANPNANMQAHIEVDGVAQPAKILPTTASWTTWTTFDFGSIGTYANSYHRVRIVFNTGGVNFNWFKLTAGAGGGGLADGTYKIINRNSGQAMDAKSQLTANGTPIQQYTYGATNNQKWTVTSLGGGQYKIIGVQSGRSLDVTGQSLVDGAKIQLYDYNAGNNQKWIITATSGGYYSIKGVQSNKFVEVAGSSTTTGALVQQWASTGANNQQWAFQTP